MARTDWRDGEALTAPAFNDLASEINGILPAAKTEDTAKLAEAKAYADGLVATDRSRLTTAESNITAITAREIPDRGRATPAAFSNSADNILTMGVWGIWTGTDAVNLGLPSPNSGLFIVMKFGSITVQIQRVITATRRVEFSRQYSGSWTPWVTGVGDYIGEVPATAASADGLKTEGWYSVSNGGTAATAGLPESEIGTVEVRAYGSNFQQRYIIASKGVEWLREFMSGAWTRWVRTSHGVKTVAMALTTSGPTSTNTTTAVHGRVPFKVAVKGTEVRFHFRNYNHRMWAGYNGSLTFLGAAFGKATTVAGEMDGSFTAGPTQVLGATTTSSAAQEWVTNWTTAPDANVPYLLSYAYTSPAGQSNYTSVGGGWQSATTSAWNSTSDATLVKTKTLPLDIWAEIKVPGETPVFAYFGDSLTAGVSADLPVYDSWAHRHAAAHNAIPMLYAWSGDHMLGTSNASHPKITKWSAQARPERMYWAMGSNDIFLGGTVSDLRTRFASAYNVIVPSTTANIFLTTILPRIDTAGSANETTRQQWNEILKTELPGNAVACYEAAEALTTAAGNTLDLRWASSSSDFHLNRAGYARFAAEII